jgi:fatty acid desaturase
MRKYSVWNNMPIAIGVDPIRVVAVYATSSALLGVYLGIVFGVTHIGMRAIRSDEQPDRLARHFDCIRNIANAPRTDAWFGGLNFHVAHHLFPGVPHRRLRRGRDAIVRFGVRHGLAYREETLPRAIVSVTHHLAAIAALRAPITRHTSSSSSERHDDRASIA